MRTLGGRAPGANRARSDVPKGLLATNRGTRRSRCGHSVCVYACVCVCTTVKVRLRVRDRAESWFRLDSVVPTACGTDEDGVDESS